MSTRATFEAVESQARSEFDEAHAAANMLARVLADAVVDGTGDRTAVNAYRKLRSRERAARLVLGEASAALLAFKRQEVA